MWVVRVVGLAAVFCAGYSDAFVTAPLGGALRTGSGRMGATTSMALAGLSMMAEPYTKQEVADLKAGKDLQQLFKGNQDWRQKKLAADPAFFKESAKGQTPSYLWIGCSDARVAANEIVGCEPGELFVHRNVANLVVNNDNSLQSVFQYAVEYLQVQHIIVCGHYDCSGISASMERVDLASPLEEWVCNIRDVYRLYKNELDAIKDPEARKRRLVELNTKEQAVNVYKTAVVQRRRLFTHMKEGLASPKVHAVVFDPTTGLLRRINTFEGDEQLDELHAVYDIYNEGSAKEFFALEAEYPKRENTPRKLFNRAPPTLSSGTTAKALPKSEDK